MGTTLAPARFLVSEITVNPQGITSPVPKVATGLYEYHYTYLFWIPWVDWNGQVHDTPDAWVNPAADNLKVNTATSQYELYWVTTQSAEIQSVFQRVFPGRNWSSPSSMFSLYGNNCTVVLTIDWGDHAGFFAMYGRSMLHAVRVELNSSSTEENIIRTKYLADGGTNVTGSSSKVVVITFTIPTIVTIDTPPPILIAGVKQSWTGIYEDVAIPVTYQIPYCHLHVQWSLTGDVSEYFELVASDMEGSDTFFTTSSVGRYATNRKGTLKLKAIKEVPRTIFSLGGTLRGARKDAFYHADIKINPIEVSITVNLVEPDPVKPIFLDNSGLVTSAYNFTGYDIAADGKIYGKVTVDCDDPFELIQSDANPEASARFRIVLTNGVYYVQRHGTEILAAGTTYDFQITAINTRSSSLFSIATVAIAIESTPVLPVMNDASYTIPSNFSVGDQLPYSFASVDPYVLAITDQNGLNYLSVMNYTLDQDARSISFFRSVSATYSAGTTMRLIAVITNARNGNLKDTAAITFNIYNPPYISPVTETFEVCHSITSGYLVATRKFICDSQLAISSRYADSIGKTPFWFTESEVRNEFSIKFNGSAPVIPGEIYYFVVTGTAGGDISAYADYTAVIRVTATPEAPVYENVLSQYVIMDNTTATTNIGVFDVICADNHIVEVSPFCEPEAGEKFEPVMVPDSTAVNIRYIHDPANPLNPIIKSVYLLKVRATNLRNKTLVVEQTIRIVVATYCPPPSVTAKTFSVREDAISGYVIGLVGASANIGGVAYSILAGNINNTFSLSETGQVILNQGGVLDYASGIRKYQLNVRCYAAINMVTYTDVTITINVLPSDSTAPEFHDLSGLELNGFGITLPVANGDFVSQVGVLERDGNGVLFSVLGSSVVGIQEATGIIYVTDAETLNAVDENDPDAILAATENFQIKIASAGNTDVYNLCNTRVFVSGRCLYPAVTRHPFPLSPTGGTIRIYVDRRSFHNQILHTFSAWRGYNVYFVFPDGSEEVESFGIGITQGGDLYVTNETRLRTRDDGDTLYTAINVYLRDTPQISHWVSIAIHIYDTESLSVFDSETGNLKFTRTVHHGYDVEKTDILNYFAQKSEERSVFEDYANGKISGGMIPCLPELLPADITPLPGTYTPGHPEFCNYVDDTGSVMVFLVNQGYEITEQKINYRRDLVENTDPCFISEGDEYSGIFVDKYLCSVEDTILVSKFNRIPIMMDAAKYPETSGLYDFTAFHDGWNHPCSAYELARFRGLNNFLMPAGVLAHLEKQTIAQVTNSVMNPIGDFSLLRHPVKTPMDGVFFGKYKRVCSGNLHSRTGNCSNGLSSASHNGEFCGVMDLNTGGWEMLGGNYVDNGVVKLPSNLLSSDITISPFIMDVETMIPTNLFTQQVDLRGSAYPANILYFFRRAKEELSSGSLNLLKVWLYNPEYAKIGAVDFLTATTKLESAGHLLETSGSLWLSGTRAGLSHTSVRNSGIRVLFSGGFLCRIVSPSKITFSDLKNKMNSPAYPLGFRTCRFPVKG